MRGNQSRLRSGLGAVLAVVLLAALPLSSATAAPADEIVVSDDPEDFTPHVLDNNVYAVAQIGGKVLVGGDFTQVQSDANSPILDIANLFAFDAQNGNIDQSFAPNLNGEVKAILPHPDGDKVWIAGAFTTLDSNSVSRLILLDVATGDEVPTFDAPSINAVVNDVNVSGNDLYIGGDFQTVGGQPRTTMASLDASTGALTDHFVPVITGTNNGGETTVRAFDLTPTGDRLVAIGNFTAIDGKTREQIAMWNTSTSPASLRSWKTTRYGNVCSDSFPSYMRDIDMSPDGSFFLVVTTGAYRAGQLCDSATRWETQDNGPNKNPSWIDYTGGDTLTAVEVTGPVAYIGGHPRWLNNPFDGDAAGSGAVPREGIAAIDTRNGLPMSWNPGRARGIGVWDFYISGSHLWAGSDTNYWANELRPRVAGFPFAGGTPIPSDRLGTLPGEVLLLGKTNGRKANKQRLVQFDGTTATNVTAQAGAEAWTHARGAFMVDDQVFTGWDNDTFTVRTFGDEGWGTPETVDLYQGQTNTPGYLSNFVNDVGRLTGIFYEPVQSRIYYTMNGNDNLYWRYFTPESRVVGAQRFVKPAASSAPLNPGSVRGMFLTGDQLYFADRSTGNLKRIGFNSGSFVGTATTVNSAIDWRAAAMALSSQPSTAGPNTPPVADFTSNCTGLTCAVDASASSDPDGAVATYAWDFGDGTSSAGKTTQHKYAVAGDYPITLTVTDNRGATDQSSQQVSVAPISSPIGFVAATSRGGGSSTRPSVTIPDAVSSGDTLLLLVSNSVSNHAVPPADWTLLDTRDDVDLHTDVFWRSATESDSGDPVAVSMQDALGVEESTPNTVTLSAYSGVGVPPVSVYAADIEQTPSPFVATSHTTPDIDVPADGSWVVSYWSDRTSNSATTNVTTHWTPPDGQALRADAYNSSGGRVTSLLTDDGTPAPAGFRLGLTATADGQTRKATMWTIVLGAE